VKRRWWEDLDLAYLAFGLAALAIRLWFAPPGPFHPWP
jgi:hypothetical protein